LIVLDAVEDLEDLPGVLLDLGAEVGPCGKDE
jgi:hypothetical protein